MVRSRSDLAGIAPNHRQGHQSGKVARGTDAWIERSATSKTLLRDCFRCEELEICRPRVSRPSVRSIFTYIRSNRSAIINYGARYRSGLRVATTLAKSAVNSLVAKRMVKKQQMRWSQHGAHMLMQVRTAE